MMKRKLLIMILTVLSVLCIFAPVNTLADNDDFQVDNEFSPNPAGYLGGNIALNLGITNTGPKDITWVDVVINTQNIYTQHWSGTIAPGGRQTISLLVPFAPDDVNKAKILQVSMNNNSSSNPDGIYMDRFEIEGISDIFDVSYTLSPSKAVYYPGDTVTITTTFTNNMPHGTALDMRSRLYMTKGLEIFDGDIIDHGNVLPGDSVSNSQTYTFAEDDAGQTINANHYADFDLMGEHYHFSDNTVDLDIGVPETEIDFTAHLSADHTEIDAGDTVTFTVQVENTGGDDIGVFEIRNTEGGLEVETEPLPAGGSGTVTINADISESTDVRYVVIGRTGGNSESLETNIVHITVREAGAPGSGASSAPGTSPTSGSDATPMPLETDAMAADTADDIDTDALPEDAAQTAAADTSPTLLLFIFGGIGLLILAALITLIVLLSKNKTKKTTTPKRDLL